MKIRTTLAHLARLFARGLRRQQHSGTSYAVMTTFDIIGLNWQTDFCYLHSPARGALFRRIIDVTDSNEDAAKPLQIFDDYSKTTDFWSPRKKKTKRTSIPCCPDTRRGAKWRKGNHFNVSKCENYIQTSGLSIPEGLVRCWSLGMVLQWPPPRGETRLVLRWKCK